MLNSCARLKPFFMIKIVTSIFLFVAIFLPQIIFAATTYDSPCLNAPLNVSTFWSLGYWGGCPPLLPCTGLGADGRPKCTDPGHGLCDIFVVLERLIYLGLTLVVFIIFPLRLIWGGVIILTAAGSDSRLSKGKESLLHTFIGLLLALGAFLIVATFLWLLGTSAGIAGIPKGVSWPNIQCQAPF